MRRSSKHSGESSMTISDFSGGLNLSVNEEMIANNELSQAENWEFSHPSGKLKTRDGMTLVKDTGYTIDTLFYADNIDLILFSSGASLYKYIGGTVTIIGTLSGSSIPTFALWDDMVLIASGGAIQSYNGSTLSSTGSPNADIVFTRAGRVVAAQAGYDRLIYSGVGDETNWTTGTDMDMVEIDVGYKDGGDITSIEALSSDIVVFKSSGSIFRVVGEYPDWYVFEITRSSATINRFSTVQVGNSAYYLDGTGFMSLNTVQTYGDIKTSEDGYKVNNILSESLTTGARMWYVSSKGQVWIKAKSDQYIWVFHVVSAAWTYFKMLDQVTGHASKDDGTEYVAIGQGIYEIAGDTDNGTDIVCYLRTKKHTANYEYFLKRITLDYINKSGAQGFFTVGGVSIAISVDYSGDVAYEDDDVAFSDSDTLATRNENKIATRCAYRTEIIEPTLQITSGQIVMKDIILNIAEV